MGDALTEIREEGREEGRMEGRKEGFEQGLSRAACNLFRSGMSISDIAKIVQIDEAKVVSWIDTNE